jgi:hypothetical protein
MVQTDRFGAFRMSFGTMFYFRWDFLLSWVAVQADGA